MPLKTAVPSACRISEPGPNAITNGQTPSVNANDVMRIGRNRNRAASTAASRRSAPASIFFERNIPIVVGAHAVFEKRF
jgi:hypothetical protein